MMNQRIGGDHSLRRAVPGRQTRAQQRRVRKLANYHGKTIVLAPARHTHTALSE
ncbi:hypothetical protein DBV15_07300 [Temnothorax longispinosus]|uniref:Uncharacterized protein n=1 Tax=Temnothorax longispinosus TaxID=300112 RepID=A0A4S2KMI6_9HYME|nr:hypothetical protein DBV15_07300 [Temnothorax longispinosus]